MLELLPVPREGAEGVIRYALNPRPKRHFHTVLDAATLLVTDGARHSQAGLRRDDGSVVLDLRHPLRDGRIEESFRCEITKEGLKAHTLTRAMFDRQDRRVRYEEVDFHSGALDLPATTYPEVTIPFLMGSYPNDGKMRSLHAWINDRFVARVYVEHRGRTSVELPMGRREAIEMLMYPDLNDWVHVGKTLTKLAKPLLPKYRMWYEPEAPHRLVRYEGPYGPPGAPEVILESLELP